MGLQERGLYSVYNYSDRGSTLQTLASSYWRSLMALFLESSTSCESKHNVNYYNYLEMQPKIKVNQYIQWDGTDYRLCTLESSVANVKIVAL